MPDKRKTATDRGPRPGADRDRKHESPRDEGGGPPSRDRNHAVGTPSPDDERGGAGEDARVSGRDRRQGRRTKDAVREVGESGYANNDKVPDR